MNDSPTNERKPKKSKKRKKSAKPNKGSSDYEVGYKKPPKSSQFKPGQSGNPKGRPKRSKNLNTLFNLALDQEVTIREHGRAQTVSLREVMVKKVVHDAVNGSPSAIKTLISIIGSDPEVDAKDLIDQNDLDILERFVKQTQEAANDEES